MPKRKLRKYEVALIEDLRKSPKEAAHYLSECLEEGDPQVFLLALRHVAEAYGGMAKLSKKAKLNRESLYRMLSEKGNPELNSLNTILQVLGFKLSIEVDKKAA